MQPVRRCAYGDVEQGFAEADYIVEGRYQTSPIEHAPTETTGCIVKPEPDGRFTVYTNTQALFFTLDNTRPDPAGSLQQAALGRRHGGWRLRRQGGRHRRADRDPGGDEDRAAGEVQVHAARRRCASRRRAAPGGIYFKDGVTKDGRIVARKVTSYADSGAYSRHTPYAVTKHAANCAGPYSIPNVWIDAYCVYTNRQPGSAMRGFGVTPASFALEVQMDKIAETGRHGPVGDPLPQRLPQRRHEARTARWSRMRR